MGAITVLPHRPALLTRVYRESVRWLHLAGIAHKSTAFICFVEARDQQQNDGPKLCLVLARIAASLASAPTRRRGTCEGGGRGYRRRGINAIN